jgi:hypothetical protein
LRELLELWLLIRVFASHDADYNVGHGLKRPQAQDFFAALGDGRPMTGTKNSTRRRIPVHGKPEKDTSGLDCCRRS